VLGLALGDKRKLDWERRNQKWALSGQIVYLFNNSGS
jgi:hypothetical protein